MKRPEGVNRVASEDGLANHAYGQTLEGGSSSVYVGAPARISAGRGTRLLLADPVLRM